MSEKIYKEKPIELIINNNNSLEISDEAINLLLSLKNEKLIILSINGMSQSGKTSLANKLISKENGFDINNSTKGIWIWGSPITLKNNIKLLIIDCESIQNNNISYNALLSILFSTYYIYNTKGNLDGINNFCNINNLISFNKRHSDLFFEIIFVNDLSNEQEIKNKIENNSSYINSNMKLLYKKQKYIQTKNIKNILTDIEISNDVFLDGEILFGLIQNYINYINHNEKIDVDSALENILLYKAKNICDNIFEEYKNELHKKIEYPTTFPNIYKLFNEIQNNYINALSKKTEKLLRPSQLGEYINNLNNYMEKEINFIININNEYYEKYFLLQFKDFEKILNTDGHYENLHSFILDYCGKFDNCLQKFFILFLNSDNSNKSFINILMKLYQEYIIDKFVKVSEQINKQIDEQNDKYIEEINKLKYYINKQKEQINLSNTLIEEKNKEKTAINKNYFELETKFDKFNRDYKIKLKENENALSIELSKYSKMENYYLSQLKDKEKLINSLENKIEKLNKEMQSLSKENTIKINELNRENNRLLNEVERIKEFKNKNGDYGMCTGSEKNVNINSILKTVNKNFIDFKESVDNLKNENNSIQKNKYLELSKEEIETKLNNVLNDVKNFCTNQIKTVSDNYEKLIKKAKTDYEELNFELSKKDYALNEQILLKETYEKKFNESNKSIEKLKSMTQDKENLINTQKSSFKVYENKINDLEMKLAENIYNLRMKEDEFESLFMIIQYMFAKNAHKFEQNLSKISTESQQFLKNLAKQYKIFK